MISFWKQAEEKKKREEEEALALLKAEEEKNKNFPALAKRRQKEEKEEAALAQRVNKLTLEPSEREKQRQKMAEKGEGWVDVVRKGKKRASPSPSSSPDWGTQSLSKGPTTSLSKGERTSAI